MVWDFPACRIGWAWIRSLPMVHIILVNCLVDKQGTNEVLQNYCSDSLRATSMNCQWRHFQLMGNAQLAISGPAHTAQIWAMTSLPSQGPVIANSMPIANCPDLGGVSWPRYGQLGIAHSMGLGACVVACIFLKNFHSHCPCVKKKFSISVLQPYAI